jgi:translation initiation factor IF-3
LPTPRILINNQIRAPELRVIGADGQNLGVITLADALKAAKTAGLDLIEVSPSATPPVAKVMDYGKFQYEQQKKEREAKAKSHSTETKSIQVTVTEGENDLTRKARNAAEWLREGHRVKYMDPKFLHERLDRFVKLIPEEYKVSEAPQKGPRGIATTLERASKK